MEKFMIHNIAIDGPAGAGKSTIARRVAKALNFVYVDTGALYRAIGIYMLDHQVDKSDLTAVAAALSEISVELRYENGEQQVILNGENINHRLRTEEAGMAASDFAPIGIVREKLLKLQRGIAAATSVVMDGRDIGTTVLPNAGCKIYLTAGVKERAERRYLELTEKGAEADLEQIARDIEARDYQDKTREISPLCQAEDAVLVDSSHMNIEQVTEAILAVFRDRTGEV